MFDSARKISVILWYKVCKFKNNYTNQVHFRSNCIKLDLTTGISSVLQKVHLCCKFKGQTMVRKKSLWLKTPL